MNNPDEKFADRTEYKYRVFRVSYRCGCGKDYDRLHKYGDTPQDELRVPSGCCTDRWSLPVSAHEIIEPDWAIVAEVYRL